MTRDYYDSVVAHLRERPPISWLEIGSVPLTAAINKHTNAAQMMATETIMPISWTESQRFLDPVRSESLEEATRGEADCTIRAPSAICCRITRCRSRCGQ